MKRFNPFIIVPVGFDKPATPAPAPAPAPYTPPPIPPEVQARRDAHAIESARREALFVELYGQPGVDPVSIPDGMMAVTLSLKYDNSDSMTDYFDRHACFGPDFLLLICKKTAQTERLARKALAIVPELAGLAGWEWHSEKYSGGHGNYLDGPAITLPEQLRGLETRYRGGSVSAARWQVEFTARWSKSDLKIFPHANYGKTVSASAVNVSPVAGVGPMKITATKHTKEHYPIWVVTLANRVDRPTFERLRDQCKALGGWYSSYRGGGAIPGFTFKEPVGADKFVTTNTPQEEEPTPEPIMATADFEGCEISAEREAEIREHAAIDAANARNADFSRQPAAERLNQIHAVAVARVAQPGYDPDHVHLTAVANNVARTTSIEADKIIPVNFNPTPAPTKPVNPLLARMRSRL